ncbi:hypothetical protein GOODEAATRI_008140 [Goodea atripinnis]|uniref:Uncharacterized protein n=1 Tax=Goodea atripinnis TaxID=208336 RepID=A0ABV0N8X1_9TELE
MGITGNWIKIFAYCLMNGGWSGRMMRSLRGLNRRCCGNGEFIQEDGKYSAEALGSAIVYSFYAFPDKWLNSSFHQWYIPIAVANTIICTILACYSSHQLFHVCGILGTHFQMLAVEQDMVTRRPWLTVNSIPVSSANSMGPAVLCVVLNLIIILLFSLPLLSGPVCKESKHGKDKEKVATKGCSCY